MALEIQGRLLSSLEKVFWDEDLGARAYMAGSALRGERFSFQAAFRQSGGEEGLRIAAKTETDLPGHVEIREVGQVPVFHPVSQCHDEAYLRTKPGLFPDPLYPHKGEWTLAPEQWRCLWVTAEIAQDAPAGKYPITMKLARTDSPEETLAEVTFTLQVIPVSLPPLKLLFTDWFHADCLATYYKVPVFSEAHWELMEAYIENAAQYGVNLLLTPVFTPPLDTEVGGERPTVQLVDVTASGGEYSFGFDKLDRYMSMAEGHGIRNFEISHLFTQWGAAAAPKIMGTADGEYRRLFGWETPSASKEYREFLRSFLRELKEHLAEAGRLERCWFHISDEPGEDTQEGYRQAKEGVWEELADCHVMDALSDYTYYEQGLVKHPIPALDKVEGFLEKGLPSPWTYYCCAQGQKVSNRFMAMPSYRNRILGCQMYKYQIEGFLHWGFNFWYSCLSRRGVNPYLETGAQDAFPAGDAFCVYPGEDGRPIPSLREVVFFEALQDMRALELLETAAGRETAVSILNRGGSLTISSYPDNPEWLLETREMVNQRIADSLGSGCQGIRGRQGIKLENAGSQGRRII